MIKSNGDSFIVFLWKILKQYEGVLVRHYVIMKPQEEGI